MSRRRVLLAAAGAAAVAVILFLVLRLTGGGGAPSAAPPASRAPAAPEEPSPQAAAISPGAGPAAAAPEEPSPRAAAVLDSQSFRDYIARVVRLEGSGQETLEIARGPQVLATLQGIHFMIGSQDGKGNPEPATEMGKDMAGESGGNLLVSEWTGKSKCCVTYHLYELGTTLRKVATIATDNSRSYFQDRDGDGRLELVTTDGTFAGWRGLPASTRPQVVLRFEEGRYRLAVSLMLKDAPDEAQLRALADRVKRSPSWRLGKEPPELARVMIDLIYTGQAFLAWRFCAEAWPPDRPGRSQFLEDFRGRLSSSPYGDQITAMNTHVDNG